MAKRKLSYTVDGNVKLSVATKENIMEILQKKKKKRIELPYNPNVTLRIFIQKI